MHLNIIQLPQGNTLSRLRGVDTTSPKGELEVALFEVFVSFSRLCSWQAFKAKLTFEEALVGHLQPAVAVTVYLQPVLGLQRLWEGFER